MTHPASGNPRWQDYPNTSTPVTAASLEAIEGALDVLSGASAAGAPVCETRLTGDFIGNPQPFDGNTYYGMRSQMAPPTGMDPFGMWQPGNANDLYTMRVPTGWGGRYHLDWVVYSAGVASKLLVIGLLNVPPATANTALGAYTALRDGGFGDPAQVSGTMVLAAGDTVSLGVYAVQNGSIKWGMYAALPGSTARSKAVMRYIGPA